MRLQESALREVNCCEKFVHVMLENRLQLTLRMTTNQQEFYNYDCKAPRKALIADATMDVQHIEAGLLTQYKRVTVVSHRDTYSSKVSKGHFIIAVAQFKKEAEGQVAPLG